MSMKTKSLPSRYRYCISRRSTLATSTLTPALKVRSTTLPDRTFFSLVRTKAPPLPGLTCWNSTTVNRPSGRFNAMPFLKSLVETFMAPHSHECAPMSACWNGLPGHSQYGELLGGVGEDGAAVVGDHDRVLDADAA